MSFRRLTPLVMILFTLWPSRMAYAMNPGYTTFESLYTQNMLVRAEEAVGKRIKNHTLVDQDGRPFKLYDLLDTPLLISMIYIRCDFACPTITLHLKRLATKGGKDFGRKFRILTVSFDPEDTPQTLKEFGKGFTGGDFTNWIFATGDRKTIKALAREVGLTYEKVVYANSKERYEFQHLNLVTLVDQKGVVYKQIYGVDLRPRAVFKYIDMAREQDRLWVRFLNVIDAMKSLCYTYDANGKYVPDFSMLVPIFLGFFIQIVGAVFFIYYFKAGGRRKRHSEGQPPLSWKT